MKKCSRLCKEGGTRGWLVAPSRQNDAHVPSMPEVEASCQLLHYRTKVSGWPGRLLVAWTHDSTQPLGQVARTPCLAKYDFSHSFSLYYIYTHIPTIQREFSERILREKPQRKTRLTHPQSSHRGSSNSYTFFLSIVKSLRDSLPKFFSHHTHICEKAIWFLGSS